MNFQIKLKDGSIRNLSFSNYFLNCVGKLFDLGLAQTFPYIIGNVSKAGDGVVTGGMMDNLEIRAGVVAAGMEAYGFANGDFTKRTLIDGWQVLEQMEDSLKNPVWAQMFVEVCKALIPDKLPSEKKAPAKKKAAPKK